MFTDSENAGFIHGPSLNHAVAAAVLRNAFITHADSDKTDPMSVNISSERVRTALSLIEGVRNGQGLAELLGYQFERGLHERYPGLEYVNLSCSMGTPQSEMLEQYHRIAEEVIPHFAG